MGTIPLAPAIQLPCVEGCSGREERTIMRRHQEGLEPLSAVDLQPIRSPHCAGSKEHARMMSAHDHPPWQPVSVVVHEFMIRSSPCGLKIAIYATMHLCFISSRYGLRLIPTGYRSKRCKYPTNVLSSFAQWIVNTASCQSTQITPKSHVGAKTLSSMRVFCSKKTSACRPCSSHDTIGLARRV
jgi:hypothetical protein